MTRTLNASPAASSASASAFSLRDRVTGVVRTLLGALRTGQNRHLPLRLRYDIGEIDINPDLVRRQSRRTGLDTDRDILRRGL